MTIIRWTGRGRLRDLENSVGRVLEGSQVKARVGRVGDSLLVDGAEPSEVATVLGHMPGVKWIALGAGANSYPELASASRTLAGKYLRRGDRFAVLAEVTGSAVVSDVAGAVTSAILGEAEGTRVDEETPRTRFRAAFDGAKGAVGVEIMLGPGGAPTGPTEAVCLVSGGKHSSVAAWMAALAGYRVSLLHARVDDESVRAVARLYSELSHRMDYTRLRLEVLTGGAGALPTALRSRKKSAPFFGGFHAGCSETPPALRGRVEAPLRLLPEEEFDAAIEGLGLKGTVGRQDWTARPPGKASILRFGGRRADSSEVLDGLTQRPFRRS